MFKLFLMFILFSFLFTGCINTAPQINTVQENFYIEFLSTGKSDCTIIISDGKAVMCDTAESDNGHEITSRLKELGIKKLEYLILTHFDKDHIGGVSAVLSSVEVGTVFTPDYESYSDSYYDMIYAVSSSNAEYIKLTKDTNFKLGKGEFNINIPKAEEYENENNYSLITSVKYGDTSFLLTGDALKIRMTEYLDETNAEQYNVIKMPHHGDYYKKLSELFSITKPQYCIINCDASRETVGKKLITQMNEFNIEPLYTDISGYGFTSDGKALQLKYID